jgi:hypothetical protein
MILELDRTASLKLAERPGDGHPLAAYHAAQLLVGVVGGDSEAIAAHNPFGVDQPQDQGGEARREFAKAVDM